MDGCSSLFVRRSSSRAGWHRLQPVRISLAQRFQMTACPREEFVLTVDVAPAKARATQSGGVRLALALLAFPVMIAQRASCASGSPGTANCPFLNSCFA